MELSALAEQLELQAVSIPERVWGGLEHYRARAAIAADYVSIPERVWGGLEPDVAGSPSSSTRSVSIPERVWGGLERSLSGGSRFTWYRFNP